MNKTLYCTTEFEVVLKMHLDFTLDAEAQEISRNIANSSFCIAVGSTRYKARPNYRPHVSRGIII